MTLTSKNKKCSHQNIKHRDMCLVGFMWCPDCNEEIPGGVIVATLIGIVKNLNERLSKLEAKDGL